MTQTASLSAAAQRLLAQFRNKECYLLEGAELPGSIAEAYAVQAEYQGALAAEFGPVAGYKIAYTTAALQQASGITEPVAGLMLAANVRHCPAVLHSADFRQPGIECEVGVKLGAALPAAGAPYTREAVAAAVESLMTAFEVVDNRRTAGQERETQLLTTIAGNVLNAGVALGAPVTDWRGLDLAAAYGQMTINGELVGDGHGADVMGHPLEPLVWLANMLAARGQGLEAGMLVITGSIVSPKWLQPGDAAVISIEGLGEAALTVD